MNTVTTHTPGPWELQEGNGHIKVFGQLPRTGAKLIAEVLTDDRKGTVSFEADRANAALIAAAPELLEALKEALRILAPASCYDQYGEVFRAIKLAETAIAKAKGQ